MKIILNNQQMELKVDSIVTLSEVIAKIESELENNHVITQVNLNEKELGQNWFFESKNIYVMDSDTLYVTSKNAKKVAEEIANKSRAQFKEILNDFEKIADSFRENDEKRSNEKFAQAIENLQYYFQVIEDIAKLYGTSLDEIKYREKTIKELISALSEKLSEIITIQQNQDWILLADFIEYELLPMLRDFLVIYDLLERN